MWAFRWGKLLRYMIWIAGLSITYDQVEHVISKYFEYKSTMVSKEVNDITVSFPRIMICSQSMHSAKKGKKMAFYLTPFGTHWTFVRNLVHKLFLTPSFREFEIFEKKLGACNNVYDRFIFLISEKVDLKNVNNLKSAFQLGNSEALQLYEVCGTLYTMWRTRLITLIVTCAHFKLFFK